MNPSLLYTSHLHSETTLEIIQYWHHQRSTGLRSCSEDKTTMWNLLDYHLKNLSNLRRNDKYETLASTVNKVSEELNTTYRHEQTVRRPAGISGSVGPWWVVGTWICRTTRARVWLRRGPLGRTGCRAVDTAASECTLCKQRESFIKLFSFTFIYINYLTE